MPPKNKNVVYYEAPQSRPAPTIETGLIGWIRHNLLSTWSDVLMTLLFTLIVVGAVLSFFNWAIHDANWWSVHFNFRQYMLGTYESELEWRLSLTVVIVTFILGMAVAVWIRRIARIAALVIVVAIVLMWGIPLLSDALIPIQPVQLTAGTAPVVIGNVNEIPKPNLSFIGQEGEVVTVRITPLATDEQVAHLSGFMDAATNGMRIVAERRLGDEITRKETLAVLDANASNPIPLLTAGQAAQRAADLERLIPIPPVTTTLQLNEAQVLVSVLNADGEPIAEAITLPSASESASFTLPYTGWYILNTTTPDNDTGVTVLSVSGVHTILQESVLLPGGGFVSAYTRMVDGFTITEDSPKLDGQVVPFFNIVRNQYWGSRPLEAYLRVYLTPFLSAHALHATLTLLAGVAGYWLIMGLKRAGADRRANQIATYGLMLAPVLIWVMASGLSVPEIFNLSVFFGAIFAALLARAVGARFGRTPLGIVLLVALVLLTMAVPFLLFRPNYGFGMLPVLNLLIVIPAFMLWLAGSDSYGISDDAENNRAVGLYAVLMLTFLLVPLLLSGSGLIPVQGNYPDWWLRTSDQRLWGGLLLTFMLTIYGIVVSFPIGVLLAVGRRSSLRIVSLGCTLYIELVRGAPFITVLFLAQLFIPLINPQFATIPGTIRALVATIMFSAAYLAENVRGGLQSLPPGQGEAAKALGLSGWQVIYYITMPQALRAVIPAILGSFVSLFKDTSLVAIVGLTDLTGFVNVMVVQQAFSGTRSEGLLFVTLIYFGFSYVMSYISRLLEASGSGAARRV